MNSLGQGPPLGNSFRIFLFLHGSFLTDELLLKGLNMKSHILSFHMKTGKNSFQQASRYYLNIYNQMFMPMLKKKKKCIFNFQKVFIYMRHSISRQNENFLLILKTIALNHFYKSIMKKKWTILEISSFKTVLHFKCRTVFHNVSNVLAKSSGECSFYIKQKPTWRILFNTHFTGQTDSSAGLAAFFNSSP